MTRLMATNKLKTYHVGSKKVAGVFNMSVTDLIKNAVTAYLSELKKDLFFLRMQHATNQLDNPLKINLVKKDIARIKTVIREKETAI